MGKSSMKEQSTAPRWQCPESAHTCPASWGFQPLPPKCWGIKAREASGGTACSVARAIPALSPFSLVIISVLMGFEDLSAQTQALGNHRATGTPFAVTTRQLLGGYGFCTFPLFGNCNERCLDVRPQETEESCRKHQLCTWAASRLGGQGL